MFTGTVKCPINPPPALSLCKSTYYYSERNDSSGAECMLRIHIAVPKSLGLMLVVIVFVVWYVVKFNCG